MDFFDALTLLGGLSLFLFGMNIMGQSLERRAGSSLKHVLGKLTDNPVVGFLTGLLVTAVIQSSSATTVMVVGFVNSGVMTLGQSISIIMGANVGTTVTAWVLSLTGITGGNFFLQMLKPSSFTPIMAIIGIILLLRGKSSKSKDTGMILLGFATLMFGLETMSSSVEQLNQVPAFNKLFVKFQNPIIGMLVGALITAIIQSSSASVGILQSFSLAGLVTYETAIPMIMGMNIGASMPIILSAIGANKSAKRSAIYYLVFNIIGTAVWLTIFIILKAINLNPGSTLYALTSATRATPLGIAIVHTFYKLLCVAIVAPLNKLVIRLICKIIPDNTKPDIPVELDDRLLNAPALALERCRILMDQLADDAMTSINLSLSNYKTYTESTAKTIREKEKQTDHLEDVIGSYLVKLSGTEIGDEESITAAEYLKLISDFERIADHSINILNATLEMNQKGITFTPVAEQEIATIARAINDITTLSYNAFVNNDLRQAFKVEPLEQVVDSLKEEVRMRHIRRLQKGICSIESGFILNDLLTSMERVSDHCSNIAGCVIDSGMHNLNLHQTLNDYKHNSQQFSQAYTTFLSQYQLPPTL